MAVLWKGDQSAPLHEQWASMSDQEHCNFTTSGVILPDTRIKPGPAPVAAAFAHERCIQFHMNEGDTGCFSGRSELAQGTKFIGNEWPYMIYPGHEGYFAWECVFPYSSEFGKYPLNSENVADGGLVQIHGYGGTAKWVPFGLSVGRTEDGTEGPGAPHAGGPEVGYLKAFYKANSAFQETTLLSKEIKANTVYKFVMYCKFSEETKGACKIWMNGKVIYEISGKEFGNTGVPAEPESVFRMGLYPDTSRSANPPMDIYIGGMNFNTTKGEAELIAFGSEAGNTPVELNSNLVSAAKLTGSLKAADKLSNIIVSHGKLTPTLTVAKKLSTKAASGASGGKLVSSLTTERKGAYNLFAKSVPLDEWTPEGTASAVEAIDKEAIEGEEPNTEKLLRDSTASKKFEVMFAPLPSSLIAEMKAGAKLNAATFHVYCKTGTKGKRLKFGFKSPSVLVEEEILATNAWFKASLSTLQAQELTLSKLEELTFFAEKLTSTASVFVYEVYLSIGIETEVSSVPLSAILLSGGKTTGLVKTGLKLSSTIKATSHFLIGEFEPPPPPVEKTTELNKIIGLNRPVLLPRFKSPRHTPSVDWRWWLVKTSNLERIHELNAHSKQLQLILNQAGTATCWIHLLDKAAEDVEIHKTALLCTRNGKPIWSGPIYKAEEKANATTETLSITALGWYHYFQRRLLHTGLEFEEMKKRYEAAGGVYSPVGIESSLTLTYGEYPLGSGIFQGVPMAVVAADLVTRANIDVPTGVTLGPLPPTNSINLPLNQFQNIGEQFTRICNLESSFDFYVDPITKVLHMERNQIRGGIAGLGVDRGTGIRFTYPGNCIDVSRSEDGMKTTNRDEVQGTYNVGKAESISSITENGLFETNDNLPEVVNTNILIAYANVEVFTLERPYTIIQFEPKSVNENINSVPKPFEDYELGDVVYTKIEKGKRFRVGINSPQPVRIYAMNVSIDDNGVEKISNLQTTYTQ